MYPAIANLEIRATALVMWHTATKRAQHLGKMTAPKFVVDIHPRRDQDLWFPTGDPILQQWLFAFVEPMEIIMIVGREGIEENMDGIMGPSF